MIQRLFVTVGLLALSVQGTWEENMKVSASHPKMGPMSIFRPIPAGNRDEVFAVPPTNGILSEEEEQIVGTKKPSSSLEVATTRSSDLVFTERIQKHPNLGRIIKFGDVIELKHLLSEFSVHVREDSGTHLLDVAQRNENGTRFQILHINGSAGPPSPVYCKSKIVLQDVRTHRKMLLGEEISGNEVNLFIALVKVDRKDLRSIQWEVTDFRGNMDGTPLRENMKFSLRSPAFDMYLRMTSFYADSVKVDVTSNKEDGNNVFTASLQSTTNTLAPTIHYGDRVELENKATSLVLSLPSDSGGVLSAMPESSRASSQSRGTVIEILHVDGMQDPKKPICLGSKVVLRVVESNEIIYVNADNDDHEFTPADVDDSILNQNIALLRPLPLSPEDILDQDIFIVDDVLGSLGLDGNLHLNQMFALRSFKVGTYLEAKEGTQAKDNVMVDMNGSGQLGYHVFIARLPVNETKSKRKEVDNGTAVEKDEKIPAGANVGTHERVATADENGATADRKIASGDGKVTKATENVAASDGNVADVDENVATVDENVGTVGRKSASAADNVTYADENVMTSATADETVVRSPTTPQTATVPATVNGTATQTAATPTTNTPRTSTVKANSASTERAKTTSSETRTSNLPGATTQSELDTLPAGWKEYTASNGRKYYNSKTLGITQWNRPSAESATSGPALTTNATVTKPTTSEVMNTTTQPKLAPLPTGWKEYTASNGRKYYNNKAKGITQWAKPVSAGANSINSVGSVNTTVVKRAPSAVSASNKTAVNTTNSQDINAATKSELAPLPSDWKEYSTSNGRKYYYNKVLKKTQWLRPVAPTPVRDASSEETSTARLRSHAGPVAKKSVPHIMPLSGNEETKTEVTTGSASVTAHTSSKLRPGSPLPTGWKIYTTPSGRKYYNNKALNITQWQRPTSASLISTKNDTSIAAVGKPSSEPQRDSLADIVSRAAKEFLPLGWRMYIDPKSGRKYYHNRVTKKSQWNRPVEPTTVNLAASFLEMDVHDSREPDPVTVPPASSASASADQEPLPVGWVKYIDDATKKPYYYQQATKTVQWDRPRISAASATTASVTSGMTQDRATKTVPESVTISSNVDKLPAPWTEYTDDASGHKYYYNQETKETTWDRPHTAGGKSAQPVKLSTADDATAAATAVDTSVTNATAAAATTVAATTVAASDTVTTGTTDSKTLPSPWVKYTDEASGKQYYFNPKSKVTQWDFPSASNFSTQQLKNSTTSAIPSPASLPAGWTKYIDDQTHLPYYYNEKTGNTQWKFPETAVHPDSTTTTKSTTAVSTTTTNTSGSLPAGWIKYIDEESHKPYYYNENSRRTQWEVPSGKNEGLADKPEDSYTEEANSVSNDSTTTRISADVSSTSFDTLPPGWTRYVDTKTGKPYYYSSETKETTWEKPTVAASVESTSKELTSDKNFTDNSSSSTSNALPPGWTKYIDDKTGKPYYYALESKETTWEKPTKAAGTHAGSSTSITSKSSSTSSNTKYGDGESDDLPAGWTKYVDENTGKPYYFSSDTKETTWEKPTIKTTSDTSVKEINNADVLPFGWTKYVDQKTGKPYYYSAETKETTWVKPITNAENTKHDGSKISNSSKTTSETSSSDTINSETLPAGWTKYVDEKSGKPYYYSAETKKTTWVKPIVNSTEESVDSASLTSNATSHTGTKVENNTDTLPAGWVKYKDEKTGKPYYYYAERKEATWERPSVSVTNSTADGSTNSTSLASDTSDMDADSHDALPQGWTKYIDEKTKNPYYYEETTKKVTWTKPSIAPSATTSATPDAPASLSKSTAGDAFETDTDSRDSSKAVVVDASDDDNESDIKSSDLPADWNEFTDPATHKKFYVNSITRKTSWTKPQENATDSSGDESDKSVDDTASSDSAASSISSSLNSTADAPTVVTDMSNSTDTKEILPVAAGDPLNGNSTSDTDEWGEYFDPASNRKYWYNSATGESTWTTPFTTNKTKETISEIGTVVTTETTTGTNNSSHVDSASPLSNGWGEYIDPKSKKTYYFNTMTGETQWTHPNATSNSSNSSNTTGSATTTVTDLVTAASSEGGVGWTEQTDPSTGRTYYFNPSTGASTWDKPTASSSTGTSNDLSAVATTTGAADTTTTSASDGWTEQRDKNGKAYYFNIKTGASQWDPPAGFSANTASTSDPMTNAVGTIGAMGAAAAGATADQTMTPIQPITTAQAKTSGASKLPEGWVAITDPSTQKVYYTNTMTGVSQWDTPVAGASSGAATSAGATTGEATSGGAGAVGTTVASSSASTSNYDLPPNWGQYYDAQKRTSYFYNSVTGETSFDRPVTAIINATSTGSAVTAGTSSASNPSVASLPAGWTRQVDPSTGKAYYLNTQTGQSSWEPPNTISDVSATNANANANSVGGVVTNFVASKGTLPSGWIKQMDNTSGRNYFLNTRTGESSWNPPLTSANARVTLPMAGSKSMLPAGWIKQMDNTSGKNYYLNTLTGESSWAPPLGAFIEMKSSSIDPKSKFKQDIVSPLNPKAAQPPGSKEAVIPGINNGDPSPTLFVQSGGVDLINPETLPDSLRRDPPTLAAAPGPLSNVDTAVSAENPSSTSIISGNRAIPAPATVPATTGDSAGTPGENPMMQGASANQGPGNYMTGQEAVADPMGQGAASRPIVAGISQGGANSGMGQGANPMTSQEAASNPIGLGTNPMISQGAAPNPMMAVSSPMVNPGAVPNPVMGQGVASNPMMGQGVATNSMMSQGAADNTIMGGNTASQGAMKPNSFNSGQMANPGIPPGASTGGAGMGGYPQAQGQFGTPIGGMPGAGQYPGALGTTNGAVISGQVTANLKSGIPSQINPNYIFIGQRCGNSTTAEMYEDHRFYQKIEMKTPNIANCMRRCEAPASSGDSPCTGIRLLSSGICMLYFMRFSQGSPSLTETSAEPYGCYARSNIPEPIGIAAGFTYMGASGCMTGESRKYHVVMTRFNRPWSPSKMISYCSTQCNHNKDCAGFSAGGECTIYMGSIADSPDPYVNALLESPFGCYKKDGGQSLSVGSTSAGGTTGTSGAPGAVEAAPGAVGATPGAVGATPGAVGATLGAVGATPGAAPGADGATPGVVGATPGAAGATPGAAPGAVGATPGVVGDTPGVVGATPGAVGSTPEVVGASPGAVGATPEVVGASTGAVGATPGAAGGTLGAVGATPGAVVATPGAYGAAPGAYGAAPYAVGAAGVAPPVAAVPAVPGTAIPGAVPEAVPGAVSGAVPGAAVTGVAAAVSGAVVPGAAITGAVVPGAAPGSFGGAAPGSAVTAGFPTQAGASPGAYAASPGAAAGGMAGLPATAEALPSAGPVEGSPVAGAVAQPETSLNNAPGVATGPMGTPAGAVTPMSGLGAIRIPVAGALPSAGVGTS